jgi:hypothetical protein
VSPSWPPLDILAFLRMAALNQTRDTWAAPASGGVALYLAATQTKATQILNHASPLTEAVVKGGNTLYRARFAGLQKDEAEVACRQLKNSEIDCIIIKN